MEILENRKNWSWEKQVKHEIRNLHTRPIKLRNQIMKINLAEGNLRDERDLKSKAIYW